MQFQNKGKGCGILILIALAVFLMTASLQAQQMNPISGKITASYTKQDSIVVAPGHNMTMSVSAGTNVNTGANPFMDGAKAINMTFADLAMGSGPHQGYLKMEKDGNTVLVKWNGTVATKMVEGSPPAITFQGTFSYSMGTGKFAGIMGQGTYKGKFSSKTDYTVEWQGDYHIMMK